MDNSSKSLKDNSIYRWETLNEKNFPQKSGEYFGLFNGVEKCIIFIQGGKVVKVKFSNNAEFSDSFRDMTKLNLSIPVKVEADQQAKAYDKLYEDFKELCRTNEIYRDENKRYRDECDRLQKEIDGWVRYKQNINEALNSGDGVYRP